MTTTVESSPVLVFQAPVLEPALYINRELSWVNFNMRVLDEALDERNKLLERVKFLSIVNSNLDEFFMVRVSGIREQVKSGFSEKSPDGMTPSEELTAIRERVIPLLDLQATFFRETLQPALSAQGIVIANYSGLTPAQQKALREYFDRMVFPVCTPLAVDPGHPFPHISNLSLNLAVELQAPNGQRHFARVKVPSVLPRLVALPASVAPPANGSSNGAKHGNSSRSRHPRLLFTWLEQILTAN